MILVFPMQSQIVGLENSYDNDEGNENGCLDKSEYEDVQYLEFDGDEFMTEANKIDETSPPKKKKPKQTDMNSLKHEYLKKKDELISLEVEKKRIELIVNSLSTQNKSKTNTPKTLEKHSL